MKYYKLQALFILSLIIVFLAACLGAWWLEERKTKQNQLSQFQSILRDGSELSRDLIEDPMEQFPNYEKKLMLVELIHYAWIQKITKTLESPDGKLKKKLKEIPLPFPEASGFFLGRGSRVLFQSGEDFQDILGKRWVKNTFLAISGGEGTFTKKQQLYLVPLSFEQFVQTKNTFQTIFYLGQYLYRYYKEVGPFGFFIIVDLKKVRVSKLKQRVQEFLLQSHENLQLADRNLFEFRGDQQLLPGGTPGLHWTGSFPGFLSFLGTKLLWILCFLAVLVWLYRLGGYRILFLRFESKLFLVLMVFLGILFISLQLAEQEMIHTQSLLDRRTAKAVWRKSAKDLENGYEGFRQKLGELVREAYKTEDPFQNQSLWTMGLYGVYFQPPFQFDLSTPALDSFTNLYLFRLSLHLLATDPYFQKLIQKDPKSVERLKKNENEGMVIVDFIRRKYGVSKIEEQIPKWVQKATRMDRSFHTNVRGEGEYILSHKAKWMRYRVLMMDQYFLGQMDRSEDGPRLLGATINAQDLFARYLQELGFDTNSLPQDSALLVEMPGQKFFSFPPSANWNGEFFRSVWNKTRHTADQTVSVRVDGENYQGSFYESEVVPNFRYLILQKEAAIFSTTNSLSEKFENFHFAFWILGLFIFAWLGRSVIRPLEILQSGFQKLKKKDYSFHLETRDRHEGAVMIHQFNSMVRELEQKEKMLPYVSSAVLDLLEQKEGKPRHSGRAVVLVSDIRSFTSLSEIYSPEEIVEMLGEYFSFWQERVEKYGGVIERFIGDAVIALFFEQGDKHFVQSAVQCSLEVYQELSGWNQQREECGRFTVRNGVGLAMGEVNFGLVGTEERMEFLSLGEPIRRAEHLETLTAHGLHSDVFVDERIKKTLEGLYDFLPVEIPDEESEYFEVKIS